MSANGASAISDTLLTIAPRDRVSSGRNAWVTAYGAEQVDREALLERAAIAEVVVERHAGVVDEDVERLDPLDRGLDLRRVGHVEDQRRDAPVAMGDRPAGAGVHPAAPRLSASSTSACPMPRLAPVTRIDRFVTVAPFISNSFCVITFAAISIALGNNRGPRGRQNPTPAGRLHRKSPASPVRVVTLSPERVTGPPRAVSAHRIRLTNEAPMRVAATARQPRCPSSIPAMSAPSLSAISDQ